MRQLGLVAKFIAAGDALAQGSGNYVGDWVDVSGFDGVVFVARFGTRLTDDPIAMRLMYEPPEDTGNPIQFGNSDVSLIGTVTTGAVDLQRLRDPVLAPGASFGRVRMEIVRSVPQVEVLSVVAVLYNFRNGPEVVQDATTRAAAATELSVRTLNTIIPEQP